MADISVTAGDTTFTKMIDAVIEYPLTVMGFILFLVIVYTIYKRPKEIWEIFKETFTFRFFIHHKNIRKKDLIDHQLFKDLQFFLDNKIDTIYNPHTFQNLDKAKLEIAHDILRVKIQDVLEWIQDFIIKTNFDDPYLNLRNILYNKIEKHRIMVWAKLKEMQIPDLFIEKFTQISKIHEDYSASGINDLLSGKIPLTVYEKMYLILGNLDIYYTAIVVNTKDLIESINGDLKGIVYKNHVIGGNDYRCYPVPSRDYIPIVENKLKEISAFSKAKRVSIYYIHDFIGDDILYGHFSKLYEFLTTGLTPMVLKFQYKSASILADLLTPFKQHQGFCSEVDHLNPILSSLFQEAGTCGIIAYPMFLHDQLKGFIAMEYNSIEAYESVDKQKILGAAKKYSSLLNIYLDYSKTGFSYKDNEVKE